jgi:hypothetical protein
MQDVSGRFWPDFARRERQKTARSSHCCSTSWSVKPHLYTIKRTEALRKKQWDQWLAVNCETVKAYNEELEARSVFSDDIRCF